MYWTKEEDLKLKEMIAKNMTLKEISIAFHRSVDAIDHRLRRLDLKKSNQQIKINDYKQTGKDGYNMILQLKEELDNLSIKEYPIKQIKSKKGDTLVVQFTDFHVGRIVTDEEGNEIYNTEIFKIRINSLISELLSLVDNNISKGTPIKDVVILATGDLVDGAGIFSTQETMSELAPPQQVMTLVEVIKNFIQSLVERKLSVTMYCVRGNHGEIRDAGGKPKDQLANWDIMLYMILKFWAVNIYKNNKVRIEYSELDYMNLEIQGWKYHIRHIAPATSDNPAGKAKFLGWSKKHKCNVIVYGHWHHIGIFDRSGIMIIRGGSMTGADEYSEQLAEESEPMQMIWGCSKNRPVSFIYAIDLGERRKK